MINQNEEPFNKFWDLKWVDFYIYLNIEGSTNQQILSYVEFLGVSHLHLKLVAYK